MKRSIRVLSLILALFMLTCAFVACNEKPTGLWENATYTKDKTLGDGANTLSITVEMEEKPQAQNAFLLTLEEPPAYAHFFLLCENAGLFLETIRSRAPVLRTQPVSREEMDRYLCEHDRRAAQMKLSDPKGYAELLCASQKGIGQALEYLDSKTFAPIKQLRTLATDFVRAVIHTPSPSAILPMLPRFSTKRDLLRLQLSALSDALRDLILLKKSENAPLSFYADREEAMELCDGISLPALYRLNGAVIDAMEENNRNANVRLCLTKMLVEAQLI